MAVVGNCIVASQGRPWVQLGSMLGLLVVGIMAPGPQRVETSPEQQCKLIAAAAKGDVGRIDRGLR